MPRAAIEHRYRVLGTAIFLATVLSCAEQPLWANAVGQETTQSDWILRGSQLLEAGEIDQALRLFAARKAESPQDARPYFYSGLALTQREDWSGAATELQEAIRLDPRQSEARILYANALSRLGHIATAVELAAPLAASDQLESIGRAWLWVLSDTLFRAGAYDESLTILDQLDRRGPPDPRVHLNRGQIRLMNGELDEARTALEKSIELRPENNPSAYFELGKVLQQQGHSTQAEERFHSALDQAPQNTEYRVKLAGALLANGKPQAAVDLLLPVVAQGETIPEIHYVLGHSYLALKQRSEAQEQLQLFQQLSESSRRGQYQRIVAGKLVGKGEEAMDRGDTTAAADWFRKAVEEDPSSWTAHGYLAEIYLASGATFVGCEHADRLRELDPEHPVGLWLTTRCRFQLGDMAGALEAGLKVRSLRPGHAELRNLLGNVYHRLGRHAEAVSEYRAAVDLAPERTDFRTNLEAAEKAAAANPR